jgi:HKD family nuclease
MASGNIHLAMVYNQPVGHRFGTALQEFFDEGEWTRADIAVAWVRRSGTQHLLPSFRDFLHEGGTLRLIVGIDIENTSQEALQDLLCLTADGTAHLFVYHNEASVTFHPKVYLFRNDQSARLVIGSNNLTQAGLFTNTEAGLQVDAGLRHPVIVEALTALDSWCDTSEDLVKELDAGFLNALVAEGYLLPETVLRRRRRQSERQARAQRLAQGARRKLFGRKAVVAPPPPTGAPATLPPPPATRSPRTPERRPGRGRVGGGTGQQPVGSVLLMRIRTARGTQVQIPIRIFRLAFFRGTNVITSTHDGSTRGIHETRPERGGGVINTLKVEIPETRNMADPVMRLERTATGIEYSVYDAGSAQGRVIMEALRQGLNDGSTLLTVPSNADRSTWCRFI